MTVTSAPVSEGRKKIKGIALMALAVMCFAALDCQTKYLTRFYPVANLVWARYTVHTLLILCLFGPTRKLKLFSTRQPRAQVIRALFLLATSLLFSTGLRYLPLAEATSIVYLAPILVLGFSAPLLKEPVGARDWLFGLLGFIGVLVIVRPGGGLLTLAALLPLAAALSNSLYMVITRKMSGVDDPITTHFYTGLIGAALMSFCLVTTWVMPTPLHLLLMLGMGLAAGIGHFLLIKAYENVAASTLAPFSYLQILWATGFGFFVFGALPDRISMLGMLVIVASGLYLGYEHSRHPRQ